jgi:hypothetical protein
MAVVTVKSGPITKRDSVPSQLSNSAVARGHAKEFAGTVEVANGDSIGSKYLMGSVPSNARMSELKLYSDDIGTTTEANIGLYEPTQPNGNAGDVVDADFFASAVSLKDGAINGQDITHESVANPIEKGEMMLFEALGLSEDPKINYDVVVTLTAAADAAGTITLKGKYAE